MLIPKQFGAALALVLVFLFTLTLPGAAAPPRDPAAGSPPAGPPPPGAKPVPPARASQDRPGGAGAPQAPLRARGPDAFGYLVSDSNERNGPVFTYYSTTQLITTWQWASPTSENDDGIAVLSPPFPVRIYGRSAVTLTISSNGLIYAGQDFCNPDNSDCYLNSSLPSANAPPALIAPLWDDMVIPDSGDSGVYTTVVGTAPNRTYVVEWRGVSFYNFSDQAASFEVLLHERGNAIEFEYKLLDGDRASGGSATVGIQSYDQSSGLAYSIDELALTNQSAVRFWTLTYPNSLSSDSSGCADPVYTGQVVNPGSVAAGFHLSVGDSNPDFSSVVTPTDTGVISPGLSVPYTVTVNMPAGAPLGVSDVTTLTVASTTQTFPVTDRLALTTNVSTLGADFAPAFGSQAGTAGTTVSYTVALYNSSGGANSFGLTAAENAWPVRIVPTDTGTIAAGASISVTVYVTIPTGTQVGESDAVVVTATAHQQGECPFFGRLELTTYDGSALDRRPLPQPRARHALVDFPANGRVYMLGGATTGNVLEATVEEYDPRADTWTARRPLLHAVSNVGAVVLGDTIYVPGGFDGTAAVDLLQTYQPASDQADLVTSDPLPAPRYGAGVVAVGGKMYVIGGAVDITGTDTITRSVLMYDPARPAGARWQARAALATGRAFAAVAALNGQIYAIGGLSNLNTLTDLSSVEVYDPAALSSTLGS